MSLTQQQTVDEILTRFKSIWDTTAYPNNVAWPDVPIAPALQQMIAGTEGVELEPWVRITVRSNQRRQRAFGSTESRLYTTNGVLFVEVFTPTGDGNTQAYELAELVRDGFETPNVSNYHVWFREARLAENGGEGLWSRITVTIEWESEQRK